MVPRLCGHPEYTRVCAAEKTGAWQAGFEGLLLPPSFALLVLGPSNTLQAFLMSSWPQICQCQDGEVGLRPGT